MLTTEKRFQWFHRCAVPIVMPLNTADGSYALREPAEVYGLEFTTENEALRYQNTFLWDETVDEARR